MDGGCSNNAVPADAGVAPAAAPAPPPLDSAPAPPLPAARRAWGRFLPSGAVYNLTAALFLRLLGLVFFCALGALLPQIPGLLGRHGLLPVADFLTQVAGPGG